MRRDPTLPEDPGILFVDDEAPILRALGRLFRAQPLRVHTARCGQDALGVLARERIQVVVSDQNMPGVPGADFLEQTRRRWPEIVRMMLTGYTEIGTAIQAINQGEIYRLITKPWNDEELLTIVRQAFESYSMAREVDHLNDLTREQNLRLQELNHTLELKVQQRTEEVKEKHAELRRAYVDTVRALVAAVDAKDSYTRGHSERVGVYASRLARDLRCKNDFIERIYLAGLLHDIGKIGVPDAIIAKPGRLDAEEYAQMKRHPEIGANILEPVRFLADVAPCVRHHHEWYDGSERGYPDRLSGHEIPYPSRIILVADTVEAMSSDRPYRKGVALPRVVEEIRRFSGTQFDPEVANAFLRMIEREEEDFLRQADKFDIESFLLESGDPA